MNDFLDNLGAEQHRKIDQPKKIRRTPQTFIDMNEEFERENTPLRLVIPTQEQIDKWENWVDPHMHERTVEPKDMVQEMWDNIGGRPE
tara:strand:+ start:319 stop:582 length:264 start_codon:yes stop_codon:yes gene_type:complete